MGTTRITKSDVYRAWERHLEIIRAAGLEAPHADLMVWSPGDRHGTRYQPVNVPTMSDRNHFGATAAYDAITAATYAFTAAPYDEPHPDGEAQPGSPERD